jgi:hypothetical protein
MISLERHVPEKHLLRAIDRFVELDGVRAHLAPFYSATGRPSIDPELLIRMLIVGYCIGIRPERRLCEEVHLNLAYRWFCGAQARHGGGAVHRANCLAGRPQRRSCRQSAAGEPHAVNFDALPLPDISFEVRVPLCLPPVQARGRLWRKPDRRHRPWIRTEKLPSAAMAQLPFGGTPTSLCAESAAMSGSPDRSTGVPRARALLDGKCV